MRKSLMAGFRRRSWELDFAPTMKASDCKTLNENKIPSGEIYTGGDFVMAQKIWMLNPNLYSRTELAFQKVQLSELLHYFAG